MTSKFFGTRTCEVCTKEFSRYFYPHHPTSWGQTRCSRKCYAVAMSARQKGEKSHLWRGGKTDENRLLRNSALADNWRKSVFERDGYRCVECGQLGGRLAADHIKPWSVFPSLRFALSNGRTLCWPCHRRIGINPGQMTREQRAKFIEEALQILPPFRA